MENFALSAVILGADYSYYAALRRNLPYETTKLGMFRLQGHVKYSRIKNTKSRGNQKLNISTHIT